jgi:hypothetical protein
MGGYCNRVDVLISLVSFKIFTFEYTRLVVIVIMKFVECIL